jgi:transcriptional regulator with XRE-family HTH domain
MGATKKPRQTQEDVEALLREKLAALVQQEREARGWTQEVLADRAGIHFTTIGKVERGIQLPSLALLVLIARALELDVSAICARVLNEDDSEDEALQLVSSLATAERRRLVPVLKALLDWKAAPHGRSGRDY